MLLFRRFCPAIVYAIILLFGPPTEKIFAGQEPHEKSPPKPPAESPSQEVQTEKIEAPQTSLAQPATLTTEAGLLRPEEIAALLKNAHVAEYRINDLLTDVKPERWKLPQPTLDSFNVTLKSLRSELDALEQWRAQLGGRTNSIYLGFQTYAAIDAVLPRVYGVARSVNEHENASYGAQFSKAGDQLFDLQQRLGAHVASLLRSQDQQILALDNNLAACQQSLGAEMRGKTPRAVPVKNARPIRPERRKSRGTPAKGKQKSETGK